MKINKLKFLFVFIFFLYSIFNYSQKLTKERKPLSEILVSIEKRHEITFTYVHEIIENIKIEPIPNQLSLAETILYLKEKTFLEFTFLTSTQILISHNTNNTFICGYLVDINSKQFIKDAEVSVLNTKLKTTSNNLGYFTLPKLTDNQVVQISHVGYPTLFLNSTDFLINNKCLTISLTEKIEELDEIILKNYLTSGISIKTDNSFIISPQKFGILPGLIEPDVLHQIQALPGISSVNETISDINIRGGTNDQNLLLWDGIKMYHSGHFFGLISAFNPYLTDTVAVIKNGTNAQYNDGVSGTITIESINEIHEKTFGGAGFNLLSVDAFAQIAVSKKIAIQVSGRHSITELLHTLTFEQYFKRAFQDSKVSTFNNEENIDTNSDFNFYDFNVKFLYNIHEKHKLRVSFLDVANNLNYSETLTSETPNKSKTSSLKQKNSAFGLQLTDDWSPKFKTAFSAYYTKYTIDAANYTLHTEQRLLQQNEVLETGLKLNTFLKISNNIKLLNGYNYFETGITNAEDVNLPIYIRIVKKVLRNHAIFSEVNFISNNNKTFVNAGFRLNYIEQFGTFIPEPRLQLLQKLNENISFKIAGEFKSQVATQIIDLQEDFLGVEKRRWILADEKTIPVIKSKQVSAGFNINKNHFFIDVEGFYKYVNGITTASQGFQNQHQYKRTSGSYTVKGVEFLINRQTKNFSSWLGYTFNDNVYNFTELSPSSFRNNLDIRHTISLGSTYTYKKFDFAIGLLWRTGKPSTLPNEENPIDDSGFFTKINYNTPNSSQLPNYFRADFSSTYKFKINKKVSGLAGISILNIFNNKNILNKYFEVSPENTVAEIDNTSLGTTPNVTFRISF
jgi:hypothetical protein